MKKAFAIWVAGILTVVPVAAYILFFKAEGVQMLLPGLVIAFWLFGYWTFLLPVLKLYRVRSLYKAIRTPEDQKNFIKNPDTVDVAVDAISSNVGVPKPVAEKIVAFAASRVENQDKPGSSDGALDVRKALDDNDMEQAAVGFISKDLGVPKFVAVKIYRFLGNRLAANDDSFPTRRVQ